MRPLTLALSAAILSACVSGGMAAAPPGPNLESVYAVRAAKSGLIVSVSSNGCTKLADFHVEVRRLEGLANVTLTRIKPDPCQSFAQGRADLQLDYDVIGLGRREAFKLANPLIVWTGPGD